jgi:hypothetical protein
MMQNSELRRDLAKISALADAISTLAAHTHADTLEAPMAELVVAIRDSYEALINRAVMAGAVERNVAAAHREAVEDREDREARRLASSCGAQS